VSSERKRAIWDVLVETCGAPPQMWDQFNLCFPECREFRFQGDLGFGGKVWSDRGRVYVNCYPEDETPQRVALIRSANAQLSEDG
jgi:hypothetical protein